MKRSILTLAATAALLLGGAGAASARTVCEIVPVPAVPAVYETTVTPAVTVTEYEFTHRPDNPGQGPANRWEADPNWNAESNPASVGWVATGNTRVRIVETEKSTVVLVSPEIPATTIEQCTELPEGESPVKVGDPEVPLGNLDPAPAPAEVPASQVPAEVPAAPLANVGQAAPVAAVTPATLPEELAYTGAADWVFPVGAALVAMGVATTVLSRRTANNK